MKVQVLDSQDLYLHISVGRWILAHHQIPDTGIYSATMLHAPWMAHEWLASIGMAVLYDHWGWGGILGTAAFLLAATLGTVTLKTMPRLGPLGAISAAVLAWGLCLTHFVARPHILSLPLIVLWVSAHVQARRENTAPPLAWALLMVLWANLHGAYFLGLALTALFAGEALFEAATQAEVRTAALRWGRFLGVALAATLLNPHGIGGLLFPLHLMTLTTALGTVYEWAPSSIVNNTPLFLWLLLLVFLALLKGIRLPICRLTILMLLLYMAFSHRRHTEILGVLAPLLIQDSLSPMMARTTAIVPFFREVFTRPAVQALTVGIALTIAAISASVLCRDVIRAPDRFTPTAALDAVEAGKITGPVLNAQNYGGYLIFRGFAPFVDGRVDMYGDTFMASYDALDQLPALLEHYHIAWTILETASPRTALMDKLPGWSRFYTDATTVVHVRSARFPLLNEPVASPPRHSD